MPERAVPGDPLAASNVEKTGNPVVEKADKPDRHGEWLADDARIWRVYERLAKLDDDEKVKRWSGGLNNLALFATLFSGITTAFIIESQGDLKPDFAELAYRVQNATAHGRAYVEEPFVVPGQARTVNCLWIASLLLSLSAALIAVMGQDWVEMYVDKPVCNPRQWAEIRSFRLNGVRRWCMPGVIATAPVLLHASLFLFGIGLAVFMASDVITQNLCIVLCAVVACLYAVIMFSPVFWSSSPFRSPATMLLRRWFCATLQRKGENDGTILKSTAKRYMARCIPVIRLWMQDSLLSAHAKLSRICSSYSPPGFLSRFPTTYQNQIRALCSNSLMDALILWICNSFPRSRDADDALPYSAAVYDAETATFVAAPSCLQNLLSSIRTRFKGILARHDNVLTRRVVFRRHAPASLWSLNFYTILWIVLDYYGPDLSNGWSDISETPLPGLVADSLTWLSSASSSPDVAELVVAGLCDHVIGSEVAEHPNAWTLTRKLRQYADEHSEHMSIPNLCRYIIIDARTGYRRRAWPELVKKRFREIIDSETPISQDFLLALVHLTSGLLDEPFHLRFTEPFKDGPAPFERLCGRIADRSPTTLPMIASAVVWVPWPTSQCVSDGATMMTLPVLIHTWRNNLPPDLRPVEQALCAMFPRAVLGETNRLTELCQSTMERPIDRILHLLIALFNWYCGMGFSDQSTRDLVLFLAGPASGTGDCHSCLAAMFGSSDPCIAASAWSNLTARDIEQALDLTCSGIHADKYHADLGPMLARMIARCMVPSSPLITGHIPAQAPLSKGVLLFELVESMSRDRVMPDDLFRPVLELGTLSNIAASIRQARGDENLRSCFLLVLGAIALWIEARTDVDDRLKLFELFTMRQATRASDSNIWDFADGIETALEVSGDLWTDFWKWGFLCATGKFALAMKALRELFPGPKYALWADIAMKVGANKHRFHSGAWQLLRRPVMDATGFDPTQFSRESPFLSAGPAVQRDEFPPSGSVVEPTNDSAGILDHPAPQIAWITAGTTPDHVI